MAISTNQKPAIYRNLYENTAPRRLLFAGLRTLHQVRGEVSHDSLCALNQACAVMSAVITVNAAHWMNVVVLSYQCCRRWPNNTTTLGPCRVFAGMDFNGAIHYYKCPAPDQHNFEYPNWCNEFYQPCRPTCSRQGRTYCRPDQSHHQGWRHFVIFGHPWFSKILPELATLTHKTLEYCCIN